MSDLATVEKLAEAVAAYYGGKILKVEETILVQTDKEEVSEILNVMGILAKTSTRSPISFITPPLPYPQSLVNSTAELEREEEKGEWIPEGEKVVPYLGELDDPAEEGKPRRVCLGCLRLFHPHRANQMVCSKTCGMRYQQRKNRNEMVGRSYAYRDERRRWEYGDEDWFKSKLAAGLFPEGSRVLTPEHNLRIIRFSGGQWCYDEVMAA